MKRRSDSYPGSIIKMGNDVCQVLEYIDKSKIKIWFLRTGYKVWTSATNIRRQDVKDPLKPSVFNIGWVGDGPYNSYGGPEKGYDPKICKEYRTWHGIIQRCGDANFRLKDPCYEGVYCSGNIRCYQDYYIWCQNQPCFHLEGSQIDKDLIGGQGNKEYSFENCVFLPYEINNAIATYRPNRTLPTGVHKQSSGRYKAILNNVSLGTHATVQEAWECYAEAKNNEIKRLSEKYKEFLCDRAYRALINYDVRERIKNY